MPRVRRKSNDNRADGPVASGPANNTVDFRIVGFREVHLKNRPGFINLLKLLQKKTQDA